MVPNGSKHLLFCRWPLTASGSRNLPDVCNVATALSLKCCWRRSNFFLRSIAHMFQCLQLINGWLTFPSLALSAPCISR
ncbi:hypothetical protein BJV78DRAFT_1221096 [Lactifluus subvellereus]|nr:hypothetical protein BJV78DRAFT_1221096 [Lactifluus subvellereus]